MKDDTLTVAKIRNAAGGKEVGQSNPNVIQHTVRLAVVDGHCSTAPALPHPTDHFTPTTPASACAGAGGARPTRSKDGGRDHRRVVTRQREPGENLLIHIEVSLPTRCQAPRVTAA